ncbi:MAG TPA: sodium:solute symporter family protein [Thermoanaerobaculia bacterium]
MNLQLVLLLAYAALLIAVGVVIGRRVTTTGAFFVAGRSLGPGLLFATVLAANIGAGSTVNAAALGYRDGAAAWWWVGSAGLGSLVLALWIGPRMWRVAKEHDLATMGDYLDWRYGPAMRAAVTSLLWVGSLALLAVQLLAMAWILAAVAGVPKVTGCLIAGLVMTAYFVAGGLVSSAWVNLVQLVVLFAGFVVALPLAARAAGGFAALHAAAPAADYWSFWQGGGSGPLEYLPLLLPAFFVSPGLIQKVYGARDARAVRLGVGVAAVVLMAFAVLPPLLGIAARALAPGLANADMALPVLLAEHLPLAVGTLGLAAVLSAEISSADAILFMLATSLSRDLYRSFLRPAASDRQVLAVARGAAVAAGALGVGLAVLMPQLLSGLMIFYSLLVVSLFVPVLAGLHTRAGTRQVLPAIAAGVAVLLAARVAGWWNPTLLGIAASAVVFGVAELIRRARS